MDEMTPCQSIASSLLIINVLQPEHPQSLSHSHTPTTHTRTMVVVFVSPLISHICKTLGVVNTLIYVAIFTYFCIHQRRLLYITFVFTVIALVYTIAVIITFFYHLLYAHSARPFLFLSHTLILSLGIN